MSASSSTHIELLMQSLNLIVTVPSLIGTTLMIYFSAKSSKINTPNRLIVFLAISDFMYSFTNAFLIINWSEQSPLCLVEGVFRKFTVSMSGYIVCLIAILHYYIIKRDETFNETRFIFTSITILSVLASAIALR